MNKLNAERHILRILRRLIFIVQLQIKTEISKRQAVVKPVR